MVRRPTARSNGDAVGRVEEDLLERPRQVAAFSREMFRFERDAIVRALMEAGGNRVKAAGILGIARSSLYRKIDAYCIRPPRVVPHVCTTDSARIFKS
jgi:transcriptional regulator with PAS, ATPase and Fis domain